MAYKKQGFENGQVLDAAQLILMEEGIINAGADDLTDDEKLMGKGFTLQENDVIRECKWTASNASAPVNVGDANYAASRVLYITKLPTVTIGEGSNVSNMQFWYDGAFLAEYTWTEYQALTEVDFVFDAVTFTFYIGDVEDVETLNLHFYIPEILSLKWEDRMELEEKIETKLGYEAQVLTEDQKAQARANIGAAAAVESDDDLLSSVYTLKAADYMWGIWHGSLDAGSSVPYFYNTSDIGSQFCTRKFVTSKVPRIAYTYYTDVKNYVFWYDGNHVGNRTLAELTETGWTVDFSFDEVAINFSWGYNYLEQYVVVKVTTATATFDKPLIIGDSISTDYYGNYSKWVTTLIDQGFFPGTTVNNSIHATGFVARYTAEDANAQNDILNRIKAITDPDTYDLVVVFAGVNDFIQSIPWGETGDDSATYFVPAVEEFFSYLTENFAQARIVVLSPLRTWNIWANQVDKYLTEYAQYIRDVAKSYCLPVLNLTEESGFYPWNETFKATWTLVPDGYDEADGVHPNAEYIKKRLTPQIKNFLSQFI